MKKIYFLLQLFLSLTAGYASAETAVNGCDIKNRIFNDKSTMPKCMVINIEYKSLERALNKSRTFCTPEKVVEIPPRST